MRGLLAKTLFVCVLLLLATMIGEAKDVGGPIYAY